MFRFCCVTLLSCVFLPFAFAIQMDFAKPQQFLNDLSCESSKNKNWISEHRVNRINQVQSEKDFDSYVESFAPETAVVQKLNLKQPCQAFAPTFDKTIKFPKWFLPYQDENKKQVAVVYVNGMFNTLDDVYLGIKNVEHHQILESLYGKQNLDVSYYLAYNPSGSSWKELKKKITSFNPVKGWSAVWGWLTDREPTPDWFKSFVATENSLTLGKLDEATIERHTQLYDYLIDVEGRDIVIISHSQGSLYTNQAMLRLQKKSADYLKHIVNVQVGTAADHLEAKGTWVTLDSDHLIEAVRLLGYDTLPDNFEGPSWCWWETGDMFCHSFADTYLGYSNSREAIFQEVRRYFGTIY